MAGITIPGLPLLVTQVDTDVYEMSDTTGANPSAKETRAMMRNNIVSNIAGVGLSVVSNKLTVSVDNTTLVINGSSQVAMENLGLSVGPYNLVTVDEYGRVTTGQLLNYLLNPMTTKGDLIGTTGTTNVSRLPVASGDGKVLQVSSGSSTGLAYSTPTYPSASGSAGEIILSDGTNNIYSTSTYPTTNAINTLLYASAANVMSALATANSGVLVTSSGGVPSISSTLPSGLTIPGFANAPVNSNITSMTGLTGNIAQPTAIATTAGIKVLEFQYTASSANWIRITNAVTTQSPSISVQGDASPAGLGFSSKGGTFQFFDSSGTNGASLTLYNAAVNQGTILKVASNQSTTVSFTLPALDGSANQPLVTNGSGVMSFSSTTAALTMPSITFSSTSGVIGTTTNNNAAAGSVGELISSTILNSSAVSFSTTVAKDLTSISLTAGDWDIMGNIFFHSTSTLTSIQGWLSSTSATPPDVSSQLLVAPIATSVNGGAPVPFLRASISSTTTYYISGIAGGAGTLTGSGGIYARRRR